VTEIAGAGSAPGSSGRAFPHIGATFTLAETASALRHVADGKAIGKVVLDIG
jgi:NADPH2:quinone reductase